LGSLTLVKSAPVWAIVQTLPAKSVTLESTPLVYARPTLRLNGSVIEVSRAFYCWVRKVLNSVRRNLEDLYIPKRERDPVEERRKDDAAVEFLLESLASDEPTPDQVAEALERDYLVQRALKMLPIEDRAVVQMSMDGMTHEEIAEALGKSRGAVRCAWRSARNRLRGELRACA